MKNKIPLPLALALAAFAPTFAFAQNEAPAPTEQVAPAAPKTSTPAGWTDNFEAAKQQAAAEGKDLFVVFSGSDWCGWCIRLEREILSRPDFTEKLSETFVPVYIDNPNDQNRLSEVAKKQNNPLTQHYRIEGFPSVRLMDADGFVFAETGYKAGGPEKYLEHVAKLAETGKASAEYAAQRKLAAIPEGPERTAQIDAILSALPLKAQIANIDFVDEVLAADPDGTLGLRAKYPYFTTVLPLYDGFTEKMRELSIAVSEALRKADNPKDPATMNAIVVEVLSKNLDLLREYREKAQQALALFPQDSVAAARLREISGVVDQLFRNYPLETAPEATPAS